MIRHLAELAALVIIFSVGIGLIVAFIAGLLLIWRPGIGTSRVEKEYRRVEDAGMKGEGFLQELVLRGRLTHGPINFPEALGWALRLEYEPFARSLAWPPYVPAFPYDHERDV